MCSSDMRGRNTGMTDTNGNGKRTTGRRLTDGEIQELEQRSGAQWMREHEQRRKTTDALQWLASVRATARAWNISEREAEEIGRGLNERAADDSARAGLPRWQRRIDESAVHVADLIEATDTISHRTVERLKQAIQVWQSRHGRDD